MKLFRMPKPPRAGVPAPLEAAPPVADPEPRYEPLRLSDLGHVRELTMGSSSSGNADANSQYYW